MPLFTADDLSAWLQYPVSDPAAVMAERVVRGWLTDATGSDVFPDPLSPQMFSWAIELGGIAHENPGGLSSETTADKTSYWDRSRRAEILGYVSASAGNTGAGGHPAPRGNFPAARAWPDAAERGWP